ncbi:Tubulin [Carpediemonas membranifera]|uniref:Tubulin n=1 Tax=Carpediemonas membranifera TaxID=201153 RepID=A0A8J6E434_9EUKA|nr:Tubulin [Carpediemonas membranifera]|eukprot:KAG9396371.1 Tubulin [Carpediemonas membranifera]
MYMRYILKHLSGDLREKHIFMQKEPSTGSMCARFMLIDTEPNVIAQVDADEELSQLIPRRNRFALSDDGAGNNWAIGFQRYGTEYAKTHNNTHPVIKRVRTLAMDGVAAVVVFTSLSGGTGSGLGSYLVAAIKTEILASLLGVRLVSVAVRGEEVVTGPINQLMAAATIAQHVDTCILCDNASIQAQLTHVQGHGLDRTSEAGRGYDEENGLIAQAVGEIALASAQPGSACMDWGDLLVHRIVSVGSVAIDTRVDASRAVAAELAGLWRHHSFELGSGGQHTIHSGVVVCRGPVPLFNSVEEAIAKPPTTLRRRFDSAARLPIRVFHVESAESSRNVLTHVTNYASLGEYIESSLIAQVDRYQRGPKIGGCSPMISNYVREKEDFEADIEEAKRALRRITHIADKTSLPQTTPPELTDAMPPHPRPVAQPGSPVQYFVLIGQCGNQLGRSILSTLFASHFDTGETAHEFFWRTEEGELRPWAVGVDLDSRIQESSKYCADFPDAVRMSHLFTVGGGAGTNWRDGFDAISRGPVSVADSVVRAIKGDLVTAGRTLRRLVFVHSTGGGTGSGGSSVLLRRLSAEFPQAMVLDVAVVPDADEWGGADPRPWVNSLLALSCVGRYSDHALAMTNGGIAEELRFAGSTGSRLSLDAINAAMAHHVVHAILSLSRIEPAVGTPFISAHDLGGDAITPLTPGQVVREPGMRGSWHTLTASAESIVETLAASGRSLQEAVLTLCGPPPKFGWLLDTPPDDDMGPRQARFCAALQAVQRRGLTPLVSGHRVGFELSGRVIVSGLSESVAAALRKACEIVSSNWSELLATKFDSEAVAAALATVSLILSNSTFDQTENIRWRIMTSLKLDALQGIKPSDPDTVTATWDSLPNLEPDAAEKLASILDGAIQRSLERWDGRHALTIQPPRAPPDPEEPTDVYVRCTASDAEVSFTMEMFDTGLVPLVKAYRLAPQNNPMALREKLGWTFLTKEGFEWMKAAYCESRESVGSYYVEEKRQ